MKEHLFIERILSVSSLSDDKTDFLFFSLQLLFLFMLQFHENSFFNQTK